MELSTHTESHLRVVSVCEDRIDAAVALSFKDAMRAQTREGPNMLVLDLSAVEFIDSSGLGAIVATMKTLGDGRRMALAGLTPKVDRVFRLTRMDTVFALYKTLAGALEDLRA